MTTKTLAKRIIETRKTGKPVDTTLRTAQQVLARITEGIYREPSSALRELISNSYDADAKDVVILTDAPRFSKMVIRDNGSGLTPEALENLLTNIGASPKQSKLGARIGVTDTQDFSLSKGGRKLIGRLGIGLFSVAQLTRHFQVITKTEGSSYRTIADITLSVRSEEQAGGKFKAGKARIWSEPAADKRSHGTEIILLELRKRTRDELASFDRWERLGVDDITDGLPTVTPPRYHIGRVSKDDRDVLMIKPSLPWTKRDKPLDRFQKLVQAMVDEVGKTESNPSWAATFDNYLQLIWKLSLAAPLKYVEKHPFDLSPKDGLRFFEISNENKGQAKDICLEGKESPRASVHFKAPNRSAKDRFDVIVDGVQLQRPVRFTDLPSTDNVIQTPFLFVGKYTPHLGELPNELTGGKLSFEAYLLWSSLIVPQEHRGVMIRIGDASGTLFDPTFMGYQVSEQVRLRQLSCEIFVLDGLDSAINIDRESFNYAHPHYQIILKWLHRAIKQFTNKHKEIGRHLREERLGQVATVQSTQLQSLLNQKLQALGVERPVEVVILDDDNTEEASELRKRGVLVFSRTIVFPTVGRGTRKSKARKKNSEVLEQRVKGAVQLLDAWELWGGLPYEDQQKVLRDLIEILTFESGK